MWSAVERFGTNAVSLIGNIILARLLSPDDFGTIGLIIIFTSIAYSLYDSGMSDSIIRKQDIKSIDYSTIFVFNLFIGFVLSIVFFLIAPIISTLFHNDNLTSLVRLYSVGIFITSATVMPLAKLRKELKQDVLARVSIFSTLSSLVIAIGAAQLGLGYWAIAIQQFSFPIFILLFLLIYSSWRPSYSFSSDVLKEHIPFSINFLFGYLLYQIGRNVNSLFVGKFFPINTMGYYTQAQKMNDVFTFSIETTLVTSSFAIIATDNDKKKSITEKLNFITYILSAVFGILILLSKPLILVLFGSKWVESAIILSMLFYQSVFSITNNYFISVLKLSNRPKLVWSISLCEKAGLILFMILLYRFGLLTLLAIPIFTFAAFSFLYIKYVSIEMKIKQKFLIIPIIRSIIILLGASVLHLVPISLQWNDISFSILSTILFIFCIILYSEFAKPTPYISIKRMLMEKYKLLKTNI